MTKHKVKGTSIFNMSIKKRNLSSDYDYREGKIKNISKKTAIDKHKKLIYNIASSKKMDDTEDDFDYEYANYIKIKRR
jgi:hypothetical protein